MHCIELLNLQIQQPDGDDCNIRNLELLLAESPSSSKRHDYDEYGDCPAS
jgi:hypothetical protein